MAWHVTVQVGNAGAPVEAPPAQAEGRAADSPSPLLLGGVGRAAALGSKKPRVPESFNQLPIKPRLKALKQVCPKTTLPLWRILDPALLLEIGVSAFMLKSEE
jgi:hypothetical protein